MERSLRIFAWLRGVPWSCGLDSERECRYPSYRRCQTYRSGIAGDQSGIRRTICGYSHLYQEWCSTWVNEACLC